MSQFLFQPYSIDGYEFYPNPIQIKLRVIKIPNEEIIDDFGINATEVVVLRRQMDEVLEQMQKKFKSCFNKVGKLKESAIRTRDFDTKKGLDCIQKLKNEPN